MQYRVRWEIDIDADNEVDAAKQAREMQLDAGASSTVFSVADASIEPFEFRFIDLDDTVECCQCHNMCYGPTAHLHQGKYIGDECCWDERFKITE